MRGRGGVLGEGGVGRDDTLHCDCTGSVRYIMPGSGSSKALGCVLLKLVGLELRCFTYLASQIEVDRQYLMLLDPSKLDQAPAFLLHIQGQSIPCPAYPQFGKHDLIYSTYSQRGHYN